MYFRYSRSLAGVALAGIIGCTAALASAPPEVPASLRPSADQTMVLEAFGKGVQIYECAPKPDSGYAWVFKAPEATLADGAGKPLGKHYAGPTWESVDGSMVVGELKAKDPGPDPAAVPWLLLAAKSHSGSGVFSSVKSIQRVATTGGIAPTGGCTAASVKQIVRVPYTATYYFYRAAP